MIDGFITLPLPAEPRGACPGKWTGFPNKDMRKFPRHLRTIAMLGQGLDAPTHEAKSCCWWRGRSARRNGGFDELAAARA
jgi:hypothetical protein